MSGRANTKLIGGFVLGAVALIVLAIIAFGSGRLMADREKFVLFFEGTVRGLSVGAPVDFRGVRIGSVVDVSLIYNPYDMSLIIPVTIEIDFDRIKAIPADPNKPPKHVGDDELLRQFIDNGLRAQLGTQSFLTGQLYVGLDLHPGTPVRLTGLKSEYHELPTIPSQFEKIAHTIEQIPLQEIASKLQLALTGIERFVNSAELDESKVALKNTLQSIDKLTKDLSVQVKPFTSNLQDTVSQAKRLIGNLDSQVRPLAGDIRETAKGFRELARNSDQNLMPLLISAQGMFDEDSPLRYGLLKAIEDLSAAARSMRNLADSLERNPEALIRGKSRTGEK